MERQVKPPGGVGILARVERALVRSLNALRVEGSAHTLNPTRVEGAKTSAETGLATVQSADRSAPPQKKANFQHHNWLTYTTCFANPRIWTSDKTNKIANNKYATALA